MSTRTIQDIDRDLQAAVEVHQRELSLLRQVKSVRDLTHPRGTLSRSAMIWIWAVLYTFTHVSATLFLRFILETLINIGIPAELRELYFTRSDALTLMLASSLLPFFMLLYHVQK
jgi:hypothetical protein